jgi:hypothetical protein
MSSFDLIFSLNSLFINKYKIYIKAKIIMKTYTYVKRKIKLLSLIYTGLKDLKQIMIKKKILCDFYRWFFNTRLHIFHIYS